MKPEVLAMFDEQYRQRAPLFGSTPTQVVVRLRSLLPDAGQILDLGSGDGRDSLYLLHAGFHVTALDLSEGAITALVRMATDQGVSSRLSATVADVTSWEPPFEAFDAVVGITVLDHIEHRLHKRLCDKIQHGVRVGGYVAIEMHSDRDPSVSPSGQQISEFAAAICSVANRNSLLLPFITGWRVLEYSDRMEHDTDHGEPHDHGFCTLLARKET